MTLSPELHRRLLELIYDLLPDGEAAELRAQIATEASLAAALEQVQRDCELLGQAARLEMPTIALAAPVDANQRPSRAWAAPSASAVRAGEQPRRAATRPDLAPGASESRQSQTARRRTKWALSLAAAALVAITLGGYAYERAGVSRFQRDYLRLIVTGPALPQRDGASYTVSTTSVAGDPLEAQVEYALYSPDGKQLLRRTEQADAEGRLRFSLPSDLAVQTGSRLQVVARHQQASERVETRLAVQDARRITYLSLDKPLYQPGETVFYRSLTLDRFGLQSNMELPIGFEIRDPSGAVVEGSQSQGATERGVGNGAFTIPAEQAGGQYTLVAQSLDGLFPEEKRQFYIRQYRLPRLKKELEFTRDSYAPGDTLLADFSAERAEGGPAAGAALSITALVDGQVVHQGTAVTSPTGTAQVELTLPATIEAGDGQLAVAIDDGGTQETIAKAIPINLGKVDVKFYPEGGDLVAGLDNRVYFVGRDPLGKPVHVEGEVINSQGQSVADLATTHEGMGSFRFRPEPGEKYTLKISKPADVTVEPALPEPNPDRRLVLSSGPGVFGADEPLEVKLNSTGPERPLVVTAFCRGAQVAQQPVTVRQAEQPVSLPLDGAVGGVVRVTVHDFGAEPPVPIAERLVYRRGSRRLQIQVAESDKRYAPGETVKLSLSVSDESGKPSAAALGVAVVDDALLNLADDDTPGMATHLLLTSEVENAADLEDADFYLSDDPEAAEALDLLLGTQGWRRFVEQKLENIQPQLAEQMDDPLVRLAALGGTAPPPAVFDNLQRILPDYRAAVGGFQIERAQVAGTIGFFASALLLFAMLLLAIGRLLPGPRVWLPVSLAAAGGLAVAVARLESAIPAAATGRQVAYHEFKLEPVAAVDESGSEGGEQNGALAAYAKAPDDRPQYWYFFGMQRAQRGVDADGLGPHADFWFDENRKLAEVNRFDDAEGLNFGFWARAIGGKGGGGFGLPQNQDEMYYLALDRDLDGRFARERLGGLQADMPFGGHLELPLFEEAKVAQLAPDRFIVRQYAHQHLAADPGVRSDFADTLYWNPLLLADADGRATIQFDLSDAVTAFRLRADAHSTAGRIGSASAEIVSRIPFNLQPKLPLEVNAGDRIDLPLAVVNDTPDELPVNVTITTESAAEAPAPNGASGDPSETPAGDEGAELETNRLLQLQGQPVRELVLPADKRSRQYYTLDVVGQKGEAVLRFKGVAGQLADAVERRLKIVPPGFPVYQSYGGKLDGEQQVTIRLPDDWVPGSLEVTLHAFPSTLADLQKGLDSILQEPTGCFEQASTSNYPNVLTLQYMREHRVADPDLTRRARQLLDTGYSRLTGYECPTKGYEWFGSDPGHEALSAYGLMQFRDMAEVYDVNPQVIERTAAWLRGRRNGHGGYLRNPQALDSFGGAPEPITDAYITWALAESGQPNLDAELAHVGRLGRDSNDPYLLALAAAGTLAAGRESEGRPLLEKLAQSQAADGHLDATEGSITRSGGLSLRVEATALAALAWLKLPAYRERASRAIEWIVGQRQGGGGFGSTQATILALKALVEHAKEERATVTGGEVIVKRDGVVISTQPFAAGQHSTVTVAGIAARLEPGENSLAISLTGENKMPYALDVGYRSRQPASDPACPVQLSTRLADDRVQAGATVALTAEVTNTRDEGQPMTIAILGLPAGLEPRTEQLDELKKAGAIDYYETRAREVICYWRGLAPRRTVRLKLDLTAEIPGRYTGPASRVYLYYTAEQKHWTQPLAVEITR